MILKSILPPQVIQSLKQTPLYDIYHRQDLLSRKSISQAGQDYWLINEAFNHKKNGYFVEIGSTDGIRINNTYLLEKRYGWRGICIEPNPEFFENLKKNRQSICLNICIDGQAGEVEFCFHQHLGGIIGEGTDNFKRRDKLEEKIRKISAIPLVDVLKDCQAPKTIDYLSIDVEGAEMRVLGGFPFDEYCFLTMTIERPKEELNAILEKNGYILVKKVPGLDSFYIHRSFVREHHINTVRSYGSNTFWERLHSLNS